MAPLLSKTRPAKPIQPQSIQKPLVNRGRELCSGVVFILRSCDNLLMHLNGSIYKYSSVADGVLGVCLVGQFFMENTIY